MNIKWRHLLPEFKCYKNLLGLQGGGCFLPECCKLIVKILFNDSFKNINETDNRRIVEVYTLTQQHLRKETVETNRVKVQFWNRERNGEPEKNKCIKMPFLKSITYIKWGFQPEPVSSSRQSICWWLLWGFQLHVIPTWHLQPLSCREMPLFYTRLAFCGP